eukprot:Gb_32421 [translate_table: standard]
MTREDILRKLFPRCEEAKVWNKSNGFIINCITQEGSKWASRFLIKRLVEIEANTYLSHQWASIAAKLTEGKVYAWAPWVTNIFKEHCAASQMAGRNFPMPSLLVVICMDALGLPRWIRLDEVPRLNAYLFLHKKKGVKKEKRTNFYLEKFYLTLRQINDGLEVGFQWRPKRQLIVDHPFYSPSAQHYYWTINKEHFSKEPFTMAWLPLDLPTISLPKIQRKGEATKKEKNKKSKPKESKIQKRKRPEEEGEALEPQGDASIDGKDQVLKLVAETKMQEGVDETKEHLPFWSSMGWQQQFRDWRSRIEDKKTKPRRILAIDSSKEASVVVVRRLTKKNQGEKGKREHNQGRGVRHTWRKRGEQGHAEVVKRRRGQVKGQGFDRAVNSLSLRQSWTIEEHRARVEQSVKFFFAPMVILGKERGKEDQFSAQEDGILEEEDEGNYNMQQCGKERKEDRSVGLN